MHKIKSFILKKFIIYDFYNLSVIKRLEPPFFKMVNNTTNGLPIHFETHPTCPNPNKGIHYVTYIPPYTDTTADERLKYKSLNHFVGFLVDIKAYDSLEAYMKEQFGSKSRSKIRSYGKRLDNCFNTTYKLYHGSIEKSDYLSVMEALERMIKRRFDQRGDEHQAEKNWGYYKETTYQFILDKKASLFVIYDYDKPIDICLNYHFDNIMINFIRAFDIDYAKFRLGYIDIFKQLEWCFENKYAIFDLGAGVFSYKKQWCHVVYNFRNDIVFNKMSILNTCLGYFIWSLLKLKLYLVKKNIVKDKANSSRDISDTINSENPSEEVLYNFKLTEQKDLEITEEFIEIDIEQNDYKLLRQTVYEYLYLNFDKKDAICIYKMVNKPNSYLIKGKKTFIIT